MNPFDQAWALLKMPLVPGSLEDLGDGFAEAAFLDPVTNMTYPVNIKEGDDELVGRIKVSPQEAHTRMMRRDSGDWQVKDSETDWDIQNRGYMKALYEAIAAYLHANRGERFTHDNALSDDGWRMWNSIYAQQADTPEWSGDGRPYYPVREDLE